MMRLVSSVVFYVAGSSGAAAQVQHFGTAGNLEPTQDLGCIGVAQVAADHTAADLASAARSCLSEDRFDAAVEAFIAMQVFGVFDTQRVSDISAHQAVTVMGQEIAQSMTGERQSAFQEAVTRFGGEGAPRHTEACAKFREIGPPSYHPDYMIQHGMLAFMRPEDPALVDGFAPDVGWTNVLVNFLKCPPV